MNSESMKKTMWEKQEMVRLLKGEPGTHYQQASDVEKTIMRDWVQSLLHKGPVTLTFVKADGTLREMNCTLDWNRIPESKQPDYSIVKESLQHREPDPHHMRVFDLDKQEWRSFRFDRLKIITASINFE